jgi:hypothetical protein
MNTALIAMASICITGVILEKVLIAFGKTDLAQMINIATISLAGLSVLTLVLQLFAKLKSFA